MAQTKIPLGTTPGEPYGYIEYLGSDRSKMIISLHGQGEIGNGKSDLYKVENIAAAEWINKGLEIPAIVLSPQCPTGSGFYHATLDTYISLMCKKYNVPRENVSLLGVSMGAYSVYNYIVNHPMKAAVCIAGSGSPSKAHLAINTRLWSFHGSKDTKVPTSGSVEFVKAYNAAKPPVPARLDIFPFEGHSNYVWDTVCRQKEVYDWLLKP